jgi:hypothetical protein
MSWSVFVYLFFGFPTKLLDNPTEPSQTEKKVIASKKLQDTHAWYSRKIMFRATNILM